MKKAKKMALQAMVCAAFAAAMVLAGCTDETSNEGDQTGVYVSDDGMKITYDNKGNDKDANFMRVFTQFVKGDSAKYSVEGVTCTIRQTNAADDNGSIFGFMFDLHKTKNADGKNVYDYYVVGIRPSDRKYYIEHYTGVPAGSFDGVANDKSITTQTGMVTKNWNGTAWANGEGGFINGVSLMDAQAGGAFSTTVKIGKKTELDGTKSYDIYIGKATSPISCKGVVEGNADKGGVAAYSCIYKGKSIAGTMTLSDITGSLNLEVAEAE